MKIPDRHEIILLLIGLNEKPFRGKTNLHKNLYLAKEMAPELELPFDFKAHFYGPFSQQVSEEIDILDNCGLIKTSQLDLGVRTCSKSSSIRMNLQRQAKKQSKT